MTRLALLAAQSPMGGGDPDGGGGPGGGTGLTHMRAVSEQVFGVNQMVLPLFAVNGYNPAGYTWVSPVYSMAEDAAEITFLFNGCASVWASPQVSDPFTIKVAVQIESTGQIIPVTFGGLATGSVPLDAAVESDPVVFGFYKSMSFRYRIFVPGNQYVNIIESDAFAGDRGIGDQLLTPVITKDYPTPRNMPVPLVIKGKTRSNVVTIGGLGDSILSGSIITHIPPAHWFSDPIEAAGLTGINFAREARKYDNRTPIYGSMNAVTHMLVQYGVNNILSEGISVAALWAEARACYAAIDAEKPGVPIWQTTPTPIVIVTSGGGATLEGQNPEEPRRLARLAWIEWLRDGCPIDPATQNSLAVGATGSVIRVGHDDHPLRGIVDIAAVVEQGGSVAPTGKWRVDLGSLAPDGVHPSTLGQNTMKPPMAAWVSTLA